MIDKDDKLNDLIFENDRLRERVSQLEEQLNFLIRHKTLAAGISGERLLSSMVEGNLTLHTAPVDFTTKDGTLIEVKFSKLSYPEARRGSIRSRWQWGKILGEKNSKNFDFLLLIGEADDRFSGQYKDSISPFVIFCIPIDEILPFLTKHTNGAYAILLTSNPASNNEKPRIFFENYQITTQELRSKFGDMTETQNGKLQ